jgi:hypothetical protein
MAKVNNGRGKHPASVSPPLPLTPTVTKVDRNCVHLSSEYFVAAELYRLGYSVAMTLGNAKAIDLFAELGTTTVNVQVKGIKSKKSGGWPVQKEKIVNGVIYVFVCLRASPFPPEFFIAKAHEARLHVQEYKTRSVINRAVLVDPSTAKRQRLFARWDKIATALLPVRSKRR